MTSVNVHYQWSVTKRGDGEAIAEGKNNERRPLRQRNLSVIKHVIPKTIKDGDNEKAYANSHTHLSHSYYSMLSLSHLSIGGALLGLDRHPLIRVDFEQKLFYSV